MKKILYIDIWDKGYRNFSRIHPLLTMDGAEAFLLQFGSFIGDVSESDFVQELDGVLVKDIKCYQTIFLRKVLKIERPDVVIILNLSFVFDRCVINLCKHLGIKVVYLAHGKLISPNISDEASLKQDFEIRSNFRRIFTKKNFLFLINYLDSLLIQKKMTKFFQLLRGIFKSPSNYLTFAHYNEELDADLMLVYTQEDKELLISRSFPGDKIKVVGNPEISEFMRKANRDKDSVLKDLNLPLNSNYFLYLDDGLLTNGWSFQKWEAHINDIYQTLRNNNFFLVIKLHPRIDISDVLLKINNKDIIVVKDCDFKNLINHSEGIISHYSSTIIYALLFNKKVICPRWGDSASLIKNYPENIVFYSKSVPDFEKTITSFEVKNHYDIENYLRNNHITPEVDSIQLIASEIHG